MSDYKIIKNPITRRVVFILGCVSTGLGIVGVFLPLLPTTPFLILATWCFFRSSPKAYTWLCRQPVLGASIQDWQRHRAISRKTKIIAGSMIVISLIFIWFKAVNLAVQVAVTCMLVAVLCFIVTRNEKRLGQFPSE